MEYRRLGQSGLKVSVLSFGSWVSFGPQLAGQTARDCLAAAYDGGVNFFDNAEVYAGGRSEEIMGEAIRELRWPRHTYVLSSKFFWGIEGSVNTRNTLNRKYLLHAVDGSLRRLGLEFLDLIFCHRPDPETPVAETVWAMHDIIESGRALYWGTSEWGADAIREAWAVAERDHLHRPVMEQPEYNLLNRTKVEEEFDPLYSEIGLGLTTWSPLASGLLSGKYLDGVPEGSRATLPGYGWLRDSLTDPEANRRVRALKAVADELGVSLAQLSIAWCASNPHVSTVITGASRVEQVRENLGALDALARLTPDVRARIDTIFH
ncbi:MAG: aldo/keto reductase [Candidatus Dormibacteraeota bacterium]|nr:aldo/keto reductase [Candidatus Dormibacteraeota bacterium]